jgi:hypothetical protein
MINQYNINQIKQLHINLKYIYLGRLPLHKMDIKAKLINMKKLLTVLAISSFAACGSGSSSTKTDSTIIVKTDTVSTMSTDGSKTMMDSTKKMMDSTKKMMDSTKK